MKFPAPHLLPSLIAVALLGVARWHGFWDPSGEVGVAAAAAMVVGAGVIFAPLLKREAPADDEDSDLAA